MSDRAGAPGTDQGPDPMQLWRQWYQQAEQFWGKELAQQQGTEAYAAMIGKTLEAYVSFQRALRESTNRHIEALGLPSRDDFARLAGQVVALEAKIDALDEKLDDLRDRLGQHDGTATRARGARPPRAPSRQQG